MSERFSNQLLLELDGLDAHNNGIYVIGATNTPWYLDSALRRPGRFNQLLFISPPAVEEREVILKLKMKDKPQNALNHKKIASKTAHFSGADLEQLVGDAIESALQRSLEMGELQPLTNNDLSQASSRRKPTTLEWFSTS
ncbi:AAA family ATPase OS=Lysinibacillus sphaericus OX=1421 GN=LS41612_00520 PE=3 SV=1 [Lysinibacillus sphaericus]